MENQSSPYDMIFLVGAAILLLYGAIFVYQHNPGPINAVIITVNKVELRIIDLLMGSGETKYVLDQLQSRDPASFSWSNMVAQTRFVGRYLRWLCLPSLLWLAWSCWKMGISHCFTREFSMKALMQANVDTFPHMAPVAWRDLDKESLDEGPWRTARQPLQYAAEHGLLLDAEGKEIPAKKLLDKWGLPLVKSPLLKPGKNHGLHVDKQKAKELAIDHLGTPFEGATKLPPYQKGLAAAFMAFGHGDKKTAFALLDQMALSFVEEGRCKDDPGKPDPAQPLELDVTGSDKVLAKYGKSEELLEHTEKHTSFTHTWFHALLEFARLKGVLECSRFIWLRPTDRTLFYVLNQVGRRVAWSEAAGEKAHFLAEEVLDQTIADPEVDEAITGLEQALHAEGWLPERGA